MVSSMRLRSSMRAPNKVHWHMCSGCRKPHSVPAEIDKEETLPAWVYRNQETVALGSLDRETRFPASIDLMRQAGLQSVCAFPLSTAHRRLGSLVIASVHRDAYSPEEVRFCSLVADQIALAMDDAINFQASQRAQERLELLLDLTNRVVSNLNLRDVLREISANIRRVMQCDGVGIDLPSPEDKKLRLYALDFPDNPGIIEEGFEPPADEKASALRVFKSGEPVILSREEIEREPSLPELGNPVLGARAADRARRNRWRPRAWAAGANTPFRRTILRSSARSRARWRSPSKTHGRSAKSRTSRTSSRRRSCTSKTKFAAS